MTEVPTLYRGLDSETAMRNHLQGILWFRSLKYFRAIDGVGRDSMEGVGSYTVDGMMHRDVADEYPVFPAFIMSYSEVVLPEYGKFVLRLSNPTGPRDRIRDRLPERSRVQWHRVRYDKMEDLDAVPDPSDDWTRKHYSKPECFAHEREWRLVIFLPPPLRLLNDTLKLHVGNLQGLLNLMPVKQMR